MRQKQRKLGTLETCSYPRLSLHPALMKAVKPAAPLPWSASRVCAEAVGTARRSSAEVALDLCRVASAMRRMGAWATVKGESRSEEHTSELQSQSNLVCRLLLEKKKPS